jgi:hypothetical protein
MEPEGSLRHLQQPATCAYAEPGQSSPCPRSHCLKIYFTIILPCMPGSPKWSPPLRSPHQNQVCAPLPSPIVLHVAPPPADLILLYLITRIAFGDEYRSLISSLCSLLRSPVTSSLLGPNMLLSTLFLNTVSLCSSLSVRDQVSHLYKTTGKI